MWDSEPTNLKLLFVHERFGALGGAESNLLATARELRKRGHVVNLLHGASTGKGETGWGETFPHGYPLASRYGAGSAREALEEFQPDMVYLHKMADLDVLEALLASGGPVVRMVHDHDLYCMRSYKYNFFTREICERSASPFCLFPCGAFVARNHSGDFPLKWVSYLDKRREIELNKKFSRLVVAGEFMKQELLRNGFDADKIEIHPPVPPQGDDSQPNDFSDRNVVIYAGQITRGKGVDVLLESLALVHAPFDCFIFGDGNHREYCQKLSRKLGLTRRVHFKGYAPPEELDIFYRECTVAVVSSVWPEPFGAVGLEALRHGVPVVAFDSGGIGEWLTNGFNGFLVPWMDRKAFATRVEELLRNKPLAFRMGEQGRRMAAKDYNFSGYIDGLEALFARVVGEKPRAGQRITGPARIEQ